MQLFILSCLYLGVFALSAAFVWAVAAGLRHAPVHTVCACALAAGAAAVCCAPALGLSSRLAEAVAGDTAWTIQLSEKEALSAALTGEGQELWCALFGAFPAWNVSFAELLADIVLTAVCAAAAAGFVWMIAFAVRKVSKKHAHSARSRRDDPYDLRGYTGKLIVGSDGRYRKP